MFSHTIDFLDNAMPNHTQYYLHFFENYAWNWKTLSGLEVLSPKLVFLTYCGKWTRRGYEQLYECPTAAITNRHKSGVLKQRKCIIVPEVRSSLGWHQDISRPAFLLKSLEKSPLPSFFQILEWDKMSHILTSCITLRSPSFPYKNPSDSIWPTRIIQDNLHISRSLIESHLQNLFAA